MSDNQHDRQQTRDYEAKGSAYMDSSKSHLESISVILKDLSAKIDANTKSTLEIRSVLLGNPEFKIAGLITTIELHHKYVKEYFSNLEDELALIRKNNLQRDENTLALKTKVEADKLELRGQIKAIKRDVYVFTGTALTCIAGFKWVVEQFGIFKR